MASSTSCPYAATFSLSEAQRARVQHRGMHWLVDLDLIDSDGPFALARDD